MSLFFISRISKLVGFFLFAQPVWATWPLQDWPTFQRWVRTDFLQEKVPLLAEKELVSAQESTFSKKLFEYSQKYVSEMLDLPFVKGIQTKSLTKEHWAYYLYQDYDFLEKISYVSIGVAADACKSGQKDLKKFLLKVHADVSNMTEGWKDKFNTLVQDYSGQEWTQGHFNNEMSAKEKYADFLSGLDRYQDFVAFLPCYFSYFAIAEKFRLEHIAGGSTDSNLSLWVAYNSDKSVVNDIRQMIQFATYCYDVEQSTVKSQMERVLEAAFRHEVDFFKEALVEKVIDDVEKSAVKSQTECVLEEALVEKVIDDVEKSAVKSQTECVLEEALVEKVIASSSNEAPSQEGGTKKGLVSLEDCNRAGV